MSSSGDLCLSTAKTNFFRLTALIVTICSDLFRNIIRSCILKPNSDLSEDGQLRHQLDSVKHKFYYLPQVEWDKLFPRPDADPTMLEKLDTALLYKIIRYACAEDKTLKNWVHNPKDDDYSVPACIQRILFYRHEIAHKETGSVEDYIFENQWEKLKSSIEHIVEKYNFDDRYTKEVDKWYDCLLDPKTSEKYVNELRKEIEGKFFLQ